VLLDVGLHGLQTDAVHSVLLDVPSHQLLQLLPPLIFVWALEWGHHIFIHELLPPSPLFEPLHDLVYLSGRYFHHTRDSCRLLPFDLM
jgi:hypothetical protein